MSAGQAAVAEGRLGRLGEWPQREGVHAAKVVVGEVPGRGLLERDAEAVAPEAVGGIGSRTIGPNPATNAIFMGST